MKPCRRFLDVAMAKAARHVTGRPLSGIQREILNGQLRKGAIVGIHAEEDVLSVLVKECEAGRYLWAFRQFDGQGDILKGAIAGSRHMAIGAFEARTGQEFGRKESGPLETPQERIRGVLALLMQAAQQRHETLRKAHIDRRAHTIRSKSGKVTFGGAAHFDTATSKKTKAEKVVPPPVSGDSSPFKKERRTEYPYQTSTEKAEKWLAKTYPHIKQHDFRGCNLETLNGSIAQFHRLAQDWPEAAGQMVALTAGTVYDHETGGVDRRPEGMPNMNACVLNGRYMVLGGIYKEDAPRKRGSPWHPEGCDSLASTMTHEFGHIVDAWIADMGTDEKGRLAGFQRSLNAPEYRAFSGYAQSRTERREQLAETWAEGFAALYHGTEIPYYAQEQKHFLDDFMRGRKK